jgi:UDP-glucose 4-epimerase
MPIDMNNDRDGRLLADTFKSRGILITGGSGYLAANLLSLLKEIDCRIVRLGRLETGWEPMTGAAQVTDVSGDIRDPAIWEPILNGIDFVFHFAAQTSTYVANDNPVSDQAINVMPMLHLLEACRRKGVSPVVCFASTVTVAGIPERLPVDESHPDHPLTIYDLHKQMAEQYLRWYAEQGYGRGVILRLANVYGPGPRSSRSDRGILNKMIRHALSGKALTVYGAGDYVRDYIFVEDASWAFIAAARYSAALNGRYFIIGSGQGHTIAEAMGMIAEHAMAKTGTVVEIQHIEPPGSLSPIEQRNFVADSRRFCEATGWRPHYTLAEGIDRTIEALI